MNRSPVGCSPWGCKESDLAENTHTNTHTHRHDCSMVIKVTCTKATRKKHGERGSRKNQQISTATVKTSDFYFEIL